MTTFPKTVNGMVIKDRYEVRDSLSMTIVLWCSTISEAWAKMCCGDTLEIKDYVTGEIIDC